MLIVCCHCCVVSCHCCAHTLLTFCFVDPRLLAFRTKAPAEAGAAPQISQRVWSWQISGAHPLAHAPCLSVSSTAVSSTAVSLHWWIAISALRTCLLRTCLTVGACRAEVKEEAATADTTIGVTDHIVHLRYTHLNCSLPYSCPKLLDERLFGVGRQKQKQQGQELR